MECKDFKYCICAEFDCTPDYCSRITGKDCNGEYWTKKCTFYYEHLYLNEGVDIFETGKISED